MPIVALIGGTLGGTVLASGRTKLTESVSVVLRRPPRPAMASKRDAYALSNRLLKKAWRLPKTAALHTRSNVKSTTCGNEYVPFQVLQGLFQQPAKGWRTNRSEERRVG